MTDKKMVSLMAARDLAKTEKITMHKAKEAVGWLTFSLTNPTKSEKYSLSNDPYVRYITFRKDGCFGFCGEKIHKSGPPTIKGSQRMARYLSVGGGMGSSKPDIALMGVMYWSDMEIGSLHIALSRYHKVPAIFVRQHEVLRNRPKRRAIWGYTPYRGSQ